MGTLRDCRRAETYSVYRDQWSQAREASNSVLTRVHVGDAASISAAINKARIGTDTAYRNLLHAEARVSHLQASLVGVRERWEIGGPDYNRWKEESRIVKYRAAIDELEHLVVMRLFELAKLGLSGTGETL